MRCREAWRGLKVSSPLSTQMTCGWQGLYQTGQQVALGSHSRTWPSGPSATQTQEHAHSKQAKSQRCSGGPGPWGKDYKDYKREMTFIASHFFLCVKQRKQNDEGSWFHENIQSAPEVSRHSMQSSLCTAPWKCAASFSSALTLLDQCVWK